MRFVHLALMCFLLPLGTSQAEIIWKSRSKKSQHTKKCVAVHFFSSMSLWSSYLVSVPARQVHCFAFGYTCASHIGSI